jgi:hypothetical protein
LERWWAVFPRDQLLVIESGELRRGDAFHRVADHLGLVPGAWPEVTDRNAHPYPPPPPALVEQLRAWFAPHNARLVAALGRGYDWTD